jgi:hypothetical protein
MTTGGDILCRNCKAVDPLLMPHSNFLSVAIGRSETAHPDLIKLEARTSQSVGGATVTASIRVCVANKCNTVTLQVTGRF